MDRVNNEIAFLYEPHHPAVLRSLKQVASVANDYDLPVTVCGEIAGDLIFYPFLWGWDLIRSVHPLPWYRS